MDISRRGSALINFIEGKIAELRKTSFFSEKDCLYAHPCKQCRNYYVSKIEKEYDSERFYMIMEKIKGGIYELKEGMTIREILKIQKLFRLSFLFKQEEALAEK